MEQKLQECRVKTGVVADIKAQSSFEGRLIFHYINLFTAYEHTPNVAFCGKKIFWGATPEMKS